MHFRFGMGVGAIAIVAACSSSSSNNPGTNGSPDGGGAGGDSGSDASVTGDTGVASDAGGSALHAEPPPQGPSNPSDGLADTTIAISKLFLGDTDRDGTPDTANGWKNYGFDIDGKISTAASTDLCQPRGGAAAKNVYPDGANGIDNSFGKLIVPIIAGIASDFATKANDALAAGGATSLFTLRTLGSGASYNPLVSAIYQSENRGGSPKYDGTDVFLIDPASLDDPDDVTKPKVVSPNAYIVNNTWVTGDKLQLQISLYTGGSFFLTLPIQAATISATLSADHQTATLGTISGVIPVTALEAQLRAMAAQTDPSLCNGPTAVSILTQVEQAADILQDGTQDPTKPCDGISIGLGFDGAVVKRGPPGPMLTPPTDACGTPDSGVVYSDAHDAFECTLPATPPSGGSCVGVLVDANDAGTGLQCNPVTNEGCAADEACDANTDSTGRVIGFSCRPAPNAVPVCGSCAAPGSNCTAGTICIQAGAAGTVITCAQYCCTNADCGSGFCSASDDSFTFFPVAGLVGFCTN
jgi:hypothetical protein